MRYSPIMMAASIIATLVVAEARATDKPNIIVILVDDMGFSDIGCYGSEIPTPHIDSLARGGQRFSQFYNTGRCCPTRASLLTGLYSHQAGIGHMTDDQGEPGYRGRLNDQCVTIAEVLRSAGYFTVMTGKWHVGHDERVNPVSRGFDRSLNLAAGGIHFSHQTGEKGNAAVYLNGEKIDREDPRLNPPWYGADLWTEQGLRFLEESERDNRPFFWYLCHTAPHFPCMAPESTIAKHRGRYKRGWDQLSRERHERQIKLGLVDPSWKPESRPADIPAWDSLSEEDRDRYDHMMAIYAAMIEEVDKNVGKLVESLRRSNQLDNTLILFMSDNGGNAESGVRGKYMGENPGDPHSNVFIGQCWAHLNNTPFRLYKHYNHEGGIASPLIAHWPAAMSRRSDSAPWVSTPAHVIDIMATCVDVGNATYPERVKDQKIIPMQGQSLRPLITGTGEFASRSLYWEHEGNAAIRVGDQKLVRKGAKGPWELFDLKADRTEQVNLSQQHPERVARLRSDWTTWAKASDVLPKPPGAKSKVKQRKQVRQPKSA